MKRPHIILHMVSTIDGKVLGRRWADLPGGNAFGNIFEPTAASFGIGAWLVGTTTMREFSGRNVKLPTKKVSVPPGDFIANLKTKHFAIGVDARAALRFSKNEVDGDHVVLLITKRASNAYLAHLRMVGVSYLFCGDRDVDLHVAMTKLQSSFGLKKLMLQGGGRFNGSMLKAKLVDEISHITIPVVDGGGPTITGFVDASGEPGSKCIARLRVLKHQVMKNGVSWVRYRVQY